MLLEEKIAATIEGALEARGYDLVAVSISFSPDSSMSQVPSFNQRKVRTASHSILNITIDRLDFAPVSIDDCTIASRIISALLDIEDLIEGRYFLNVSSPGEHRSVRNPAKNLPKFCGMEVMVELLLGSPSAIATNCTKIQGVLQKCDRDEIHISPSKATTSGAPSKIFISDVKKVTVHRTFRI